MKRIYIFAALLAAILGFNSCESRPDIAGTWTGGPISLTMPENFSVSMIETLDIQQPTDASSKTGNITVSGIVNTDYSLVTPGEIAPAVNVQAPATFTVNGTWRYESNDNDEDDIIVNFDYSTLKIDVNDAKAVVTPYTTVSDADSMALQQIKAASVSMINKNLGKVLNERLQQMQRISDMEVKNGVLSCEISHRDYVFHNANK